MGKSSTRALWAPLNLADAPDLGRGHSLFSAPLAPQLLARRVANDRVRGVGQVDFHIQVGGTVRGGTAIYDSPVLQLQGRGAGVDQPGMTPAQPDQVLVGPQHRLTPGGEFGGGVRQGGTDGIVPTDAFLLDTGECLLVAVVDRRCARDGHENGQRGDGPIGSHPAGDAGDVMVADESVRCEGVEELVVTVQGVVQLEQVAVVDAGPDGLPELVLGHRVDAGFGDESAVVAVQHLPEQPCPGVPGSHPLHHLGPEPGGNGVGRVETPPVDSAVQPVVHHPDRQIHGFLAGVVQAYEGGVPLEHPGPRASGMLPVDVEQSPGRGTGPFRQRLLHSGVALAHVTEHPVQEDAEPPVPALGDELGEIGFIPEAGVYAERIDGVVAVGL